MTSDSGSVPACRPGTARAMRMLAPFALALLGTAAGFLAAALVGRARRAVDRGRPALDLAPGGDSIDFDKGGFRVRARGADEEPPYTFEPEAIMSLPEALRPAAGIQPTFDVDAEIARALEPAQEPALVR